MGRIQHPLLPTIASSPYVFHPIPTPYLPVFIVAFQALALLPPVPAAYAWEILNLLGTTAYLWFFAAKIERRAVPVQLIALTMVSAPVFLNLFTGQVNLLLAICAGEYLRAAMAGRPLQSGVWLGGLLLKPQCSHSDRTGAVAPAFFQDDPRTRHLKRRHSGRFPGPRRGGVPFEAGAIVAGLRGGATHQ